MKREQSKSTEAQPEQQPEKKRLQLTEDELKSLEGSELADVVGGWPGSPACM